MSIVVAILIFSLIILFHEFGHFLLAKLNGITVLEFALGMGPILLSKEWRGTRYALKLLPFGGSCMMLGEDEEEITEGSFAGKSALARISVIAAGPFFNFVMAFIASALIIAGLGIDPPVIADVTEGLPAQTAGIAAGDTVISMNGKRIHLAREITNYLHEHQGETIELVYEHDHERHKTVLEPMQNENGTYVIGISINRNCRKATVPETIMYSAYEVRYWIDITIKSLQLLVRGKAQVTDISGPVGVIEVIDDAYTQSAQISIFAIWINMLNIAVLLSANLGVMNLLPIPALDGGRLVFLILELIRGKRIDPQKEGMVHFAGLMLLLLLMVFVMYNDILKLF